MKAELNTTKRHELRQKLHRMHKVRIHHSSTHTFSLSCSSTADRLINFKAPQNDGHSVQTNHRDGGEVKGENRNDHEHKKAPEKS